MENRLEEIDMIDPLNGTLNPFINLREIIHSVHIFGPGASKNCCLKKAQYLRDQRQPFVGFHLIQTIPS